MVISVVRQTEESWAGPGASGPWVQTSRRPRVFGTPSWSAAPRTFSDSEGQRRPPCQFWMEEQPMLAPEGGTIQTLTPEGGAAQTSTPEGGLAQMLVQRGGLQRVLQREPRRRRQYRGEPRLYPRLVQALRGGTLPAIRSSAGDLRRLLAAPDSWSDDCFPDDFP